MVLPLVRIKNRILARLLSLSPRLSDRWAKSFRVVSDASPPPWSELGRPLGQARLGLVTTAGLHLADQPAFDMTDPAGDPSFRLIPDDAPVESLRISHDYYDHRDAEQDPNIVLPIERLHELVVQGVVGSAAPRHISFMGHVLPPHLSRLIEDTAPRAARILKEDAVDAVLLTPA